jgi:membrane associated rhomboid family serine protease
LLLADNPGSTTLYAFTEDPGDGGLDRRLDELATGLTRAGVLSHGPVNLVAVVALDGTPHRDSRSLVRTAPRTYYENLRPFVWTIDLESGQVAAPRRFGQPEGREQLEKAADIVGSTFDVGALSDAGTQHGRQMTTFRNLVQGRRPIATYALIALNVAMFGLVSFAGGTYESNLPRFGALIPSDVMHGQWWRLVAAMFLHAGAAHILFNMVSLFVVGSLAERLYGSLKFLGIYLGSGLLASLAGFFYSLAIGDMSTPHVGASGAIFGIAGALMTLRFQRSDVIPLSVRQRISSSMLMLVVINLIVLAFTPNIDNAAHIGGLAGGMALSFVFPLVRSLPDGAHR